MTRYLTVLSFNACAHGAIVSVRNEVAKVMFSQACVCPQGGVPGPRGVGLLPGGVPGPGGVCLVPGGVCLVWGVPGPGGAQSRPPREGRLLLRTVRILLESIIVSDYDSIFLSQ